jgi:putative tryptophan/tyrosine transport system substrate-binding protein
VICPTRGSVQSQAESGFPTRNTFRRKSYFSLLTARVIHKEWRVQMRKARALSILFVVLLVAVAVTTVEVGSQNDFSKAFLSLVKEQAGALMVLPAVLFARNDNQIADLAIKSRLPAIFYRRRFAEVGGLMAYGASLPELWRRVGVLVGKILNGSNPSDLPVEQPTKFELVINLKTAKQMASRFRRTCWRGRIK